MCVDYQKNIYIKDEDPKVYVALFRHELGDDAYEASCRENALPIGFEDMDFTDFLSERRVLMSKMIREAYLGL